MNIFVTEKHKKNIMKGRMTTSDYLDFNNCKSKANELLLNPKLHKIGLYIYVAIYSGLRNSDIRLLRWEDLNQDKIRIQEQKTKKYRTITLNPNLKKILEENKPLNTNGYIFSSQKNTPYSIQALNRLLKEVFSNYTNTKNISTHTFRKTFGRAFWDYNNRSEEALIRLMDIFEHSSLKVTKTYLGITAEEKAEVYMNLP